MLVVYNGAHPEVVVDALSQEQVIVAGEPAEIPDDLAARLLEQSTWQAADKKAEKVQKQIDADLEAAAPDLNITTDDSAPAEAPSVDPSTTESSS